MNRQFRTHHFEFDSSMSGDHLIRTDTKKDVGVIPLLIPNSGLGCHHKRISNAASPRQG